MGRHIPRRGVGSVFDEQFDRLPLHGHVLDAGCGLGHQTERLVARQLRTTAIDFSRAAVEATRNRVGDRAVVLQADLTDLPFEDCLFDSTLCYGVLMHVPNIRPAVAELARVTRSTLVVSKGNMQSVDDLLFGVVNRLRGRRTPLVRDPAGIRSIVSTSAGPLLVRHADDRG